MTTRTGALSMASSTSSGLLLNLIILMMLQNMEERTPIVMLGMVCCACSSFSGVLRGAQYTLHGLIGIKTY
jgi:hypothetical protein